MMASMRPSFDFEKMSRSELKAAGRTSALLSGFSMVALVELAIPEDVSETLLIAFGTATAALIFVHLFALLVSTCILPTLDASIQSTPFNGAYIENEYGEVVSYVYPVMPGARMPPINTTRPESQADPGGDVTGKCRTVSSNSERGDIRTMWKGDDEKPTEKRAAIAEAKIDFRRYVITAWLCSTGLGIILFLAEVAIIAWVKFDKHKKAAVGVTCVIVPMVIVIIVFAIRFYRKITAYHINVGSQALAQAETMRRTLQMQTSIIYHTPRANTALVPDGQDRRGSDIYDV